MHITCGYGTHSVGLHAAFTALLHCDACNGERQRAAGRATLCAPPRAARLRRYGRVSMI